MGGNNKLGSADGWKARWVVGKFDGSSQLAKSVRCETYNLPRKDCPTVMPKCQKAKTLIHELLFNYDKEDWRKIRKLRNNFQKCNCSEYCNPGKAKQREPTPSLEVRSKPAPVVARQPRKSVTKRPPTTIPKPSTAPSKAAPTDKELGEMGYSKLKTYAKTLGMNIGPGWGKGRILNEIRKYKSRRRLIERFARVSEYCINN